MLKALGEGVVVPREQFVLMLVQQAGLEWAFRLAMEPRRLWRRYARIVPRFLAGFAAQRFRQRAQNARAAETARA